MRNRRRTQSLTPGRRKSTRPYSNSTPRRLPNSTPRPLPSLRSSRCRLLPQLPTSPKRSSNRSPCRRPRSRAACPRCYADHRAARRASGARAGHAVTAPDAATGCGPTVLPAASPSWMAPPSGTETRPSSPMLPAPQVLPATPPIPPSAPCRHPGCLAVRATVPAVHDPVGGPGVSICRALRSQPQAGSATAAHAGARGAAVGLANHCRGHDPAVPVGRIPAAPAGSRCPHTAASTVLLGPAGARTRDAGNPTLLPMQPAAVLDGAVLPPLRDASAADRLTFRFGDRLARRASGGRSGNPNQIAGTAPIRRS